MEIRLCKKEEINQVKDIWKYCFEDSEAYVNFYFDKKFNHNNVVVSKDGDRLISSIHLNQHDILMNGKKLNTSYVVGVSTLPEARGRGIMNGMMLESLKEMLRRGQTISILMPIDFRLYTKFGFSNCYDMILNSVDIFELKKFRYVGNFKKATAKDASELKNIYSSAVSDYNGFALRDEAYFLDLIEEMDVDGGNIYINYINGIPSGYIVYSISGGVFIIREIYSIDITSYKSILKFVFNHNTQCKRVEMMSSIDDPLRILLDNPKDATFEIKPFMMARIIDFKKYINDCEFVVRKSSDEESILIKINDEYLTNNDKVFKLVNKSGILFVEDSCSQEYEIELDISEATKIFTKYSGIDEVLKLREDYFSLSENGLKDRLERLLSFSKEVNHINEYV
ncbi:MAG: GNAT family N-acetyltransferase [Peptostreptococcus porci]|nr:GNAT family N-acetyltransferase [Peptostreptococcus porci]